MVCPKCGKEMNMGALAETNKRGGLFWADNDYFRSKINNFFTVKDAVKNGGINIPIRNGITNDRTKAWACKDCNMVMIDCAEN